MRPLIPRVRVGDVLKGTKNLRNYLQTAATLDHISSLVPGLTGRKARPCHSRGYHPSKEDEFLVTVNARNIFGVWSNNNDVVLLFVNPHKDKPRKRKPTVFGLEPLPSRGRPSTVYLPNRMDPTIFSKWFIHTPKKYVDLTTWPSAPYYMWMSLHLNMSSAPGKRQPLFCFPPGPSAPFSLYTNGRGWDRDQSIQLIREQVVQGVTRSSHPSNHLPTEGFGPRLEETDNMRQKIAELCSNPRIEQQYTKEDSKAYKNWLRRQ